jgi:single-strand DNA-binding protein
MTGLPTITCDGVLVRDPELIFTPKGTALAKWRIACNERRYNAATSQWEDGDSTYLTGSAWRTLGEHVAASLRKGDRVIVTGVLRQREWEKDGARRTDYEVEAISMGPSLMFAPTTPKNPGNTAAADDPWATEGAPF